MSMATIVSSVAVAYICVCTFLLVCVCSFESSDKCKDRSKKMNPAAYHTLMRPGMCFKYGVHKSIMVGECDDNGVKFHRYKESADCSGLHGREHTFRFPSGCDEVGDEYDDDHGEDYTFVEKHICKK